MISEPNKEGGSEEPIDILLILPSGVVQEQIDKRCDELVEKFGQKYKEQVFLAVIRQARKLEGKSPMIPDLKTRLEQRNYVVKNDKNQLVHHTVIIYKGVPLVDVELSDYFYIKDCPLHKQPKQ